MMMKQIYVLVSLVLVAAVEGFAPLQSMPRAPRTILGATETDADPNDIIGRRIQVKGDVNGGYYRSCVSNEVSTRSWFYDTSIRWHTYKTLKSWLHSLHFWVFTTGWKISRTSWYHDSTWWRWRSRDLRRGTIKVLFYDDEGGVF
jgi:hypothetical protein